MGGSTGGGVLKQSFPRFVIAGTHSGAGKTSISLAVVAALARRGLKVQTFKVGPDFLDPGHLAAASGRPCYNLDGWMCGRTYVEGLFGRVAAEADVAVVEGVMGLFDGASPYNIAGSTAEVAAWLDAPVMLVVNAHGMAGSLAAVAAGFAGLEPGVHVAGVVANFCGSARHVEGLARSLSARPGLPPLVGAVPRGALPQLASRHLGLVSADPAGRLSAESAAQLADAAENHIDLDRMLRSAEQAPTLDADTPEAAAPAAGLRLAVARDKAFHFYYQDLFDALAARGCEIVFFSPLADQRLPEHTDALYLGGGYPEAFAAALSANRTMLQSIREFADTGKCLYAECGGLIYLSRGITTLDGKNHALLGILPVHTRMLPEKKFLGYVEVKIKAACFWGAPGDVLRGHEFHYSELVSDPSAEDGWQSIYALNRRRGGVAADEGFQRGKILASYVHLHLAGRPRALDHFINVAKERRMI
ncbi:MAG: cobyrinate a,c-diamide synthase [Desulfobacteraceae bacterium]|nr:MAG: cobyrinate a,c-diamide synthase [Desulfobacteraceae bacterium]